MGLPRETLHTLHGFKMGEGGWGGLGGLPVEGFLGGAQVVLGLLQLPHPALPALLLLNAGLVSPVRIPGQSASGINL